MAQPQRPLAAALAQLRLAINEEPEAADKAKLHQALYLIQEVRDKNKTEK